ncbi:glycerophosphodiester phosphodiesterase [Secundilactobacillus folii]|uniref:Glycerophosphodiester phosphodiesterase n=1 Tax=Secundilactobacillus folii TaxID=2678357 RepID=A0A7X3C368_9LACO|nr:glycerophosphodiester phosphodiesterase family protein [Secundilactobacillus folii]MTV82587.1 glycerophosphodiester phosphodiesterase [Secundilactobacillus folii]
MSTLIFGHRGIPVKFPENSLQGFRYAIEHNVEGLEFDVHLTRDQVPVIIHDEKINRTTNGKGRVCDFDYEELATFSLSNGESVPKLDDFLTLVGKADIILNLEFKTDQIHYPGIEQIVLAQVSRFNLRHPVIYSSFNLESLRICQLIDDSQNYCYLADHSIRHPLQFLQEEHLNGLHLHRAQNEDGLVERIWTVNNEKRMLKLFSRKVDGIFTDDFEKAMMTRDQLMVI